MFLILFVLTNAPLLSLLSPLSDFLRLESFKMKMKSILFAGLTALSITANTSAFANNDWRVDFQAPSEQSPKLVINLPADIDFAILTSLGVELDGIDVTSLVSFENSDFSYQPIEPLNNGEHQVRLIMMTADGQTVEKAKWSFTVDYAQLTEQASAAQQMAAAEAWLLSADFEADTLTEYSNRNRQRNIGSAPDHSILSGSGNLHANLQGKSWSVDARSNYLLQSDSDLALNGHEADIGEYAIRADFQGDSVQSGVSMGHHNIGLDSLLFSSFQRRGVSAHVATINERVAGNMFAFRPDTQTGLRDFTGLSDSNNRLEGVSATIKPFSSDNDALKVTGFYYDGEGSTGGIGISGEEEMATASGTGIILEKSLARGRVDFRAEYAHAKYDADGNGAQASEDDSDAWSLILQARPFENLMLADKPVDIIVGTKHERIATFFESLANQGLASDRDATSLYSHFYWGGLSGSVNLIHETNNVDDLVGVPTDRMRNLSWNANYAFYPQADNLAWLGSPYLSFSGFSSRLDRKDTPDSYLGADTDNSSDSYTLGGGSSYQTWYWSASHTLSSLEDHADTASDVRNNFSSLGVGWIVSERLSLNTDLQYGVFEDKDNEDTGYNTNMNFGLRSVLIPDTLDLNVNYNLNLVSGSDDSPDKHIVNSELAWTIRQAQRNNPGFALALRGSVERTNGNTSSTDDETQYQIFAVFRVMAPLSAGF